MALTKEQRSGVSRALEAARMERANFKRGFNDAKVISLTEGEVTAFIRERTRVYRETWIIPWLENLLETK